MTRLNRICRLYSASLAAALLAASSAGPVLAADGWSLRTDGLSTSPPPAMSPDRALLEQLVKDLELTLQAPPEETTLRLPLTAGHWALGPLQPYAALGPRVMRVAPRAPLGLAGPEMEPPDMLSQGLGVGPGVRWRLSNSLQLFGEYLIPTTPSSTTGQPASPTRRDVEAPTLKGGFSIRF